MPSVFWRPNPRGIVAVSRMELVRNSVCEMERAINVEGPGETDVPMFPDWRIAEELDRGGCKAVVPKCGVNYTKLISEPRLD